MGNTVQVQILSRAPNFIFPPGPALLRDSLSTESLLEDTGPTDFAAKPTLVHLVDTTLGRNPGVHGTRALRGADNVAADGSRRISGKLQWRLAGQFADRSVAAEVAIVRGCSTCHYARKKHAGFPGKPTLIPSKPGFVRQPARQRAVFRSPGPPPDGGGYQFPCSRRRESAETNPPHIARRVPAPAA